MEIAAKDETKFIDFPRSTIFIGKERSGRLLIEDNQRARRRYGVGSASDGAAYLFAR
jgi:hypothetical protein